MDYQGAVNLLNEGYDQYGQHSEDDDNLDHLVMKEFDKNDFPEFEALKLKGPKFDFKNIDQMFKINFDALKTDNLDEITKKI